MHFDRHHVELTKSMHSNQNYWPCQSISHVAELSRSAYEDVLLRSESMSSVHRVRWNVGRSHSLQLRSEVTHPRRSHLHYSPHKLTRFANHYSLIQVYCRHHRKKATELPHDCVVCGLVVMESNELVWFTPTSQIILFIFNVPWWFGK